MATATGIAKEREAPQAHWRAVDLIHIGLTSEEEFDRLIEHYCPLNSPGPDEE